MDRVEVTFPEKSDQNRLGLIVPRARLVAADGVDGDVRSKRVLEMLLDLLDLYPTLDGVAPLIQSYSASGWGVINRSEVTRALHMIVGGTERILCSTLCTRGELVAPRNHRGTRGHGCPNTESG